MTRAEMHRAQLLAEYLNEQSERTSAMYALLSLCYPCSILYEMQQLQPGLLKAIPSQNM